MTDRAADEHFEPKVKIVKVVNLRGGELEKKPYRPSMKLWYETILPSVKRPAARGG